MRGLAVAVALTLAAAGCGGDDEKKPERTTARTQPGEVTPPPSTTGAPAPKPKSKTATGTSPEQQPGGGGDEAPASSPAMFRGNRGRIRPTVVRVPPFLAVRVELRSADGREYALSFRGHLLRAGGQVSTSSTTIEGLRHGQVVVGRPAGGEGNAVRIEANAEPGP